MSAPRLPLIRSAVAITLCVCLASAARAQTDVARRPVAAIAEEYVALALQSNLTLQGQRLEVERAEAALAAARSHFLPEIALQARYTQADGGREFNIPTGTLLNPAYQTLNELLVAAGQAPRFSSLPDVTVPFQRQHEQDTRITLRQPLYAPAIPAAAAAQTALVRGANAATEVVARQLRRDVYLGYLDWLKALRAREVLESSRRVLDENLRINESLFANGRVTEDQVLRARAEQLALIQQLQQATSQIDLARSYVNFLLNRPLETALEEAIVPLTNSAHPAAAGRRPELEQADAMGEAARAQQRAALASLRPSLSLGVDAGTQGTSWQLGPAARYISASLVLSWKFFDGGATRAEADRARLAARQSQLQEEALSRQFSLEVQQSRDRLQAAEQSIAVAEARTSAARAALRIAERKRDAGTITQVEFLDARNALTNAELALNVNRFEVLQRDIELRYAAGDGAGNTGPENREGLP